MTVLPSAMTASLLARLMLRELRARGLDCEAVLRRAGLSVAQVEAGRGQLDGVACLRLVEVVLALDLGDDFMVCAGAGAVVADLDLPGLYLRSSARVRDALEFYRTHGAAIDPSPITRIYVTDTTLVVALPERERSAGQIALAELYLATSVAFVVQVAGPLPPIEVRFRHARPENDGAHVRVFGVVHFDSDVDAVFLPVALLERPLPHHDAMTLAVLQPHLSRQVERAEAVRDDLRLRVLDGIREELDGGRASVEALAKRLRVSPRSLRRELSALGTSYSELLAEVRHDLARSYALEAPPRAGAEIAQRLGYADAHTFYRAFKRWTGASLSDYRKRARPLSAPPGAPANGD